MSVLDLTRRLTRDRTKYQKFSRSSDSYVFVEEGPNLDVDQSRATIDLAVGDRWFLAGQSYVIPDDGLDIPPRRAAVIETQEYLAVPLNAFGLVSGKGSLIFQGLFISSGKIDPGFEGRLRIGIFNASEKHVHLKRGQPFCMCVFTSTEYDLDGPIKHYETTPGHSRPLPTTTRMSAWLRRNAALVIATVAASATLANFIVMFLSRK